MRSKMNKFDAWNAKIKYVNLLKPTRILYIVGIALLTAKAIVATGFNGLNSLYFHINT